MTRDPESRTTQDGKEVCNFTVACNRRQRRSQNNNDQPEADFFRVSAFNELGKVCQQYLAKGRKVAVVGSVSVNTYTANDGITRASMNVLATDVEFLNTRNENGQSESAQTAQETAGTTVDTDQMPF